MEGGLETEIVFTGHASNRMRQRGISEAVVDVILAYGESGDAGAGARSHWMGRQGLRDLRRDNGGSKYNKIRRIKELYLIANRGRVITAAYGKRQRYT